MRDSWRLNGVCVCMVLASCMGEVGSNGKQPQAPLGDFDPSWEPPITVVDPPGGGDEAGDGSTDLGLTEAPDMPEPVRYVPNRSSVILYLPAVAGARDYRVFVDEPGVTVTSTDNREHVAGATIHCAGLRQRNQCDDGARMPIRYNNPVLDLEPCVIDAGLDRRPNVPAALMQTLEIVGLGPSATLVVEAIDRQCPFPGLYGPKHRDQGAGGFHEVGDVVSATIDGVPRTLAAWDKVFHVYTEAEIRAQYGSMILNGQGPNLPVLDPNHPSYPESPFIRLAQAAPPDDPVVLARAIIEVETLGTSALPEGFTEQDFFEGFDEPDDQVTLVRQTDPLKSVVNVEVRVSESNNMIYYDVAHEESTGYGFADFFIDRGALNMLQADPSQNTMSLQAMYPKRAAKMPTAAGQYLHVTYEAQANETQRRYQHLALCGSDQLGGTYDGDFLKSAPLTRPNFMNSIGGRRTNIEGWNCLLLVPRGMGYWAMSGARGIPSHSDSMLRIAVTDSHPKPTSGQYDSQTLEDYMTNFGPEHSIFGPMWERQIDAGGHPVDVWLDDQMNAWQKTKFDVFVRNDRVVIYVNGEQRICADLSASPLTMAEAGVGFWHVLYHSSAEFMELRADDYSANPGTGQRHILNNTPFADHRSWDNVGFREDVALPASFDDTRCY